MIAADAIQAAETVYPQAKGKLTSHSRKHHIAHPRQVVFAALHLEGLSYPKIGRAFNRDHTTAMYGASNALKKWPQDVMRVRTVARAVMQNRHEREAFYAKALEVTQIGDGEMSR